MFAKQPSGALTDRVKQADEMTASTIFSVGFAAFLING
jgi:hypothetical protein